MRRCFEVLVFFLAMLSCSSDDDTKFKTQDDIDQEAEVARGLLAGKWKVTGYAEFFEGKETRYEPYQCEMLGTTRSDLINNTYQFNSDGSGVSDLTCDGGGESVPSTLYMSVTIERM